MTQPLLACTVRACGLPIERVDRAFVCARGHTFDVAREGYVNLLQPQDRRSAAAGDSRASIEARSRLLSAGVGRLILDRFVARAAALGAGQEPVVVDLGSGSGDALGALSRLRPIAGIGIDLSPFAATRAARRFPSLTWLVANADRRLPLLDHRVDVVLSLHGRRNVEECARVLAPNGFLLMAVPAPDDLIELRALVQGERQARERGPALVAEQAPRFALLEHVTVREGHRLERDQLRDLLLGTYRGARAGARASVATLDSLDVTLASEIFLFAPR